MPTRSRRRDGRRVASGRGEETKERSRAKRVIRNVQRCGSFRYGQMEIPDRTRLHASRLPPDAPHRPPFKGGLGQVTGGWVPAALLVSLVATGFSTLVPSAVPLRVTVAPEPRLAPLTETAM